MDQIVCEAPAKINLTLDILRRRPDGYHDLCMVMQSISLCDRLTVKLAPGGGIHIHMPGSELSEGPDNLVWKAAQVFFRAADMTGGGAEITVVKQIPAQAGMAGGSTDAAAALRALNELCGNVFSSDALEKLGQQIGSDVPFCVRGGAALAEGRGERLTTLPGLPPCGIVVCKPDFGLPTPELFRRVRVDALRRRPDTEAMLRALERGSLSEAAEQLANVFEEVLTEQESREISGIEDSMRRQGAMNAAMTGSGPTVFGLFENQKAAARCAEELKNRWTQVFLAEPR